MQENAQCPGHSAFRQRIGRTIVDDHARLAVCLAAIVAVPLAEQIRFERERDGLAGFSMTNPLRPRAHNGTAQAIGDLWRCEPNVAQHARKFFRVFFFDGQNALKQTARRRIVTADVGDHLLVRLYSDALGDQVVANQVR